MASQSLSWLFQWNKFAGRNLVRCRRCHSPLRSARIGDAGYPPLDTEHVLDRGPFCPDAGCAMGEASAHVQDVRTEKRTRVINGVPVTVTVYVTRFRE